MVETIIAVFIFFSLYAFGHKRLLRYFQYFQQEQYLVDHFASWFFRNKAFDKKGSAATLLAGGISIFMPSVGAFVSAISLIALFYVARTEADPRKAGKLPLKMTERVKAMFRLSLFLYTLTLFVLISSFYFISTESDFYKVWLLLFLQIQLIPGFLLLSFALLLPFEKAKQNRLLSDAKRIIREFNPYVIGVTGSYGKTSTKNMLGEILHEIRGNVFWPQKGINTPMGITREIRERLKQSDKYAVVEMGAYKIGSIKRLCDLTPPSACIVTAVGLVHLDRFGSAENVYLAKSELPQAVPADGVLVCNGDDPQTRRMAVEHKKKTTILYGMDTSKGHLDCVLINPHFDIDGSHFEIQWKDKRYQAYTKLLGAPALQNILASFSMACALGFAPELVVAAIRNIQPVDNRLSLKKAGEVIYLNDAYNSNPAGFKAALDVLKELASKRKILVTPGMIELGNEQFEENRKIAEYAASICDELLFVGPTNKEAFEKGFLPGAKNKEAFKYFETRTQALSHLTSMQAAGDCILIENDLPDLFEDVPSF